MNTRDLRNMVRAVGSRMTARRRHEILWLNQTNAAYIEAAPATKVSEMGIKSPLNYTVIKRGFGESFWSAKVSWRRICMSDLCAEIAIRRQYRFGFADVSSNPRLTNAAKHCWIQNSAKWFDRNEVRSRKPRRAADIDPPIQNVPVLPGNMSCSVPLSPQVRGLAFAATKRCLQSGNHDLLGSRWFVAAGVLTAEMMI